MPSLARITNTFFTDLIERLAIRPPFNEGFEISNVVQPVSIVDSGIQFSAILGTQILDAPYTAGPLVNPAAEAVLAATIAQNDGNYAVIIMVGALCTNTPVFDIRIERRNAADNANIWSQIIGLSYSVGFQYIPLRMSLEQGELVKVKTPTGVVAGTIQASIWITPVS